MAKGNAKLATDRGQGCGPTRQESPDELERAAEGNRRRQDPGDPAAREKNAFVERCVVGRDEGRPVELPLQLCPDFAEGGGVCDVTPGDPVNGSKGKGPSRRSNEPGAAGLDRAGANSNEPDGAGALRSSRGRLEVERDEGRVIVQRRPERSPGSFDRRGSVLLNLAGEGADRSRIPWPIRFLQRPLAAGTIPDPGLRAPRRCRSC